MSHRVLVVDDNADVRQLAVLSLSRIGGFDVRSVASGQACLTEARGWRPDLILLDVMMPDMDGPATLVEVRADGDLAATPVIFLTAGVVESELRRLLEMPVSGLLSKPFDALLLPRQVTDLLGW